MRSKCKFSLYFFILLIAIFLWLIRSPSVTIIKRNRPFSKDEPKMILVWNSLFGRDNWAFKRNSNEDFRKMNCKITNCIVTDDRDQLDDAHAVMFHQNLLDRPKYKFTDQRWVLLSHETPCHIALGKEENLVNWTQTYRLDSDIFMEYGNYCKRKQPIEIDFKSILKQKKKLVAWFVSNCQTHGRRNDYVKTLLKYIDIDIYGRCSKLYGQNNYCENRKLCFEMLNKTYKFYLSFENSFHQDYLTEKYFKIIEFFTVPIVRGDGNYSAVGVPHSYINTNRFNHPRELAEYLYHLDSHDDQYINYLKFKQIYRVDSNDSQCRNFDMETSYCRLCQKLNDPNESAKYYKDVQDWFGECRQPSDIKEYTGTFTYLYEVLLIAITSLFS